jgi:hypothetical protein
LGDARAHGPGPDDGDGFRHAEPECTRLAAQLKRGAGPGGARYGAAYWSWKEA